MLLNTIYDNKIDFPLFLERKVKITNPYTFVYGVKFSGKTFLIYDYLNSNKDKNYLYIDLKDFKISFYNYTNLDSFIKENNIEILIVENYTLDFVLPKVDSIIVSNEEKLLVNNFEYIKVQPLDFEEYLLFDTKHQNTTNSFNSFLKYGNLPEIIDFKDFKKQSRLQEIIKLFYQNETALYILKLFIKHSAQTKSIYQLFTLLKKDIKVSKDYFYKIALDLQKRNIIYFIPKYNQEKAVKKIFCFNHALIDSINYNKNFAYIFANMVFLELNSRYKEIFYLDNIDFFIKEEKTIILCMPFYNTVLFTNNTKKILNSISGLDIDLIQIITISTQDTIYIDDISCEILPFYNWAVTL